MQLRRDPKFLFCLKKPLHSAIFLLFLILRPSGFSRGPLGFGYWGPSQEPQNSYLIQINLCSFVVASLSTVIPPSRHFVTNSSPNHTQFTPPSVHWIELTLQLTKRFSKSRLALFLWSLVHHSFFAAEKRKSNDRPNAPIVRASDACGVWLVFRQCYVLLCLASSSLALLSNMRPRSCQAWFPMHTLVSPVRRGMRQGCWIW